MGCGDNDKVLVNAVRALGNLFAIRMQEPTHDPASSSPSDNSMDTQTSCSSSTAAAEVLTRASNANQGVHGETSGKAALLEENGAWWGSLCQDQAWFHAGLQCLLASLHSQTEKVIVCGKGYRVLCNSLCIKSTWRCCVVVIGHSCQ